MVREGNPAYFGMRNVGILCSSSMRRRQKCVRYGNGGSEVDIMSFLAH